MMIISFGDQKMTRTISYVIYLSLHYLDSWFITLIMCSSWCPFFSHKGNRGRILLELYQRFKFHWSYEPKILFGST